MINDNRSGPDTGNVDQQTLHRLRTFAHWSDEKFKIPFLGIRIGIDPLVGLIPLLGDSLGTLIGMYVLAEAFRFGLPASIIFRMALNLALEQVVGSVPVVGDVFDIAWKANSRNVRLFQRYVESPQELHKRSRLLMLVLFLPVGGILAASIAAAIWILVWLLW